MKTTKLTYTGPRPKIFTPPAFLFDIEKHQQLEAAIGKVLKASGVTHAPKGSNGKPLYIQGIDKDGVVYWDEQMSSGGEETRFDFFEWIPVASTADIPPGALRGM